MEGGHMPKKEEEPAAVYNEDLMDDLAREYLEAIKPDLSTVVRLKGRDSSLTSHSCWSRSWGYVDTTKRSRDSSEPAKRSRRTRTMSSPGDTYTMPQLPPGPLAELLPAGTIVRRPPGKLVQLVAQAIHESPLQALRVWHVYEALKKRYPYFIFMDKKEQTTWKVRITSSAPTEW